MDTKELNKYPIRCYLADKGIHPVKDRGYYGMYHSPLREDRNASMKVDFQKNLWIDFGLDEGGALIDLVMRLESLSRREASQLVEEKMKSISFSFHSPYSSNSFAERGRIKVKSITNLSNPALLLYLKERGINLLIAQTYCREINYQVNESSYFAIGFKNEAGGYELRNKYFKGCIAPKDITRITLEGESCNVFEGFIDFLSYLSLKDKKSPAIGIGKEDHLILNSVLNLHKALSPLNRYKFITCYLDNDVAGKKAFEELKNYLPQITDGSIYYKNHKDINEYLCCEKKMGVKEKNNLNRSPQIPKPKYPGRRRFR